MDCAIDGVVLFNTPRIPLYPSFCWTIIKVQKNYVFVRDWEGKNIWKVSKALISLRHPDGK